MVSYGILGEGEGRREEYGDNWEGKVKIRAEDDRIRRYYLSLEMVGRRNKIGEHGRSG